MILHGVTDHVGDLDEAAVVLLVQGPQDAPLHGLETIGQIRNRAVADDVAGVIQEAAVHPRVQAAPGLLGIKRLVDDGFNDFRDDMTRAVWGGVFFRRGCRRGACGGQSRLTGLFLFIGWHELNSWEWRGRVILPPAPRAGP